MSDVSSLFVSHNVNLDLHKEMDVSKANILESEASKLS